MAAAYEADIGFVVFFVQRADDNVAAVGGYVLTGVHLDAAIHIAVCGGYSFYNGEPFVFSRNILIAGQAAIVEKAAAQGAGEGGGDVACAAKAALLGDEPFIVI